MKTFFSESSNIFRKGRLTCCKCFAELKSNLSSIFFDDEKWYKFRKENIKSFSFCKPFVSNFPFNVFTLARIGKATKSLVKPIYKIFVGTHNIHTDVEVSSGKFPCTTNTDATICINDTGKIRKLFNIPIHVNKYTGMSVLLSTVND